MSFSISSLRADFPAFSDQGKYPDSQITVWAAAASMLLPPNVWGELLDLGTELFVAHQLALQGASARDAANPGSVTGPVSSKSVGPLSVGYDTGAITLEGMGLWNATTYGIQFIQLAQMVGAGALQV